MKEKFNKGKESEGKGNFKDGREDFKVGQVSDIRVRPLKRPLRSLEERKRLFAFDVRSPATFKSAASYRGK